MAYALYRQRTGSFEIYYVDDGGNERLIDEFTGYAGRGRAKNNPSAQALVGRGPLPRGRYRVGGPFTHPRLGPHALRLEPYTLNEMHGRSGFLIHGDSRSNPGNASHGCIILPRNQREAVTHYDVRVLEVVE